MITYVLRQNKNAANESAYLKYYASAVIDETIDIDGLTEHMVNHHLPYSKGTIRGVLSDMVICIKELIAAGKAVKIADLAIFKARIVSKKGCETKTDYNVTEYVEGVKLSARATGEFSYSTLTGDVTLKRSSLDKDATIDDYADDDEEAEASAGTAGSSGTTGSGTQSGSGASGSDGDSSGSNQSGGSSGGGDGDIDPLA